MAAAGGAAAPLRRRLKLMAGTQVAGMRNLVGTYNEAYAEQALGVITSYTTDHVRMRWRIGTASNTLDVPFDGAIPRFRVDLRFAAA